MEGDGYPFEREELPDRIGPFSYDFIQQPFYQQQEYQNSQFQYDPSLSIPSNNNWSLSESQHSQNSQSGTHNHASDASTHVSTPYDTDNYTDKCKQEKQEQMAYQSYGNSFSSSLDHQKIRKQIGKSKKYQPLFDNNAVFVFEDNPEEYKKARKRLQNRQSARKVRGIKKNHEQNLEMSLDELQKENQDLKVQVAELSAQNKRLRDEVSYFRGLFKQNHLPQSKETNHPQTQAQQNPQNNIQPVQYPTNNGLRQDNFQQSNYLTKDTLPYTRVGAKNSNNLQYSQNLQLFVVVIISCLLIVGYSNSSSSDFSVKHVNVMMQFEKEIITQDKQEYSFNNIEVKQSVDYLLHQSKQFEMWKNIGLIGGIILYSILVIYTLVKIFRKKFKLSKQKEC